MYMNIVSLRSILILIKSRKNVAHSKKIMIVFDVLPINDSRLSFEAVQ